MPESLIVVCPQCHSPNRVPAARISDQGRCGQCKARLHDGHPVPLDNSSFDRHVQRSGIPLVIDFWAPWCGPCRAMAPAFEQAARTLGPGIQLAKLNTEEAQAIAGRLGIRSIPTLIIFQNGRETARQSGAMDHAGLTRWIRNNVSI